jgi:hypothetical protein
MNFQSFSDEQARVIVNLDQACQAWMGDIHEKQYFTSMPSPDP